MRILSALVVLTLLFGFLVAQEETEGLSGTDAPQEAGDGQETDGTTTEVPAVTTKHKLKTMYIITAPLRNCPAGQKRDASGRCRPSLS